MLRSTSAWSNGRGSHAHSWKGIWLHSGRGRGASLGGGGADEGTCTSFKMKVDWCIPGVCMNDQGEAVEGKCEQVLRSMIQACRSSSMQCRCFWLRPSWPPTWPLTHHVGGDIQLVLKQFALLSCEVFADRQNLSTH